MTVVDVPNDVCVDPVVCVVEGVAAVVDLLSENPPVEGVVVALLRLNPVAADVVPGNENPVSDDVVLGAVEPNDI